MWYHISLVFLLLLSQIVEEEVDEYGVDLRIWFEFQYLLPEEFDAPDTAA